MLLLLGKHVGINNTDTLPVPVASGALLNYWVSAVLPQLANQHYVEHVSRRRALRANLLTDCDYLAHPGRSNWHMMSATAATTSATEVKPMSRPCQPLLQDPVLFFETVVGIGFTSVAEVVAVSADSTRAPRLPWAGLDAQGAILGLFASAAKVTRSTLQRKTFEPLLVCQLRQDCRHPIIEQCPRRHWHQQSVSVVDASAFAQQPQHVDSTAGFEYPVFCGLHSVLSGFIQNLIFVIFGVYSKACFCFLLGKLRQFCVLLKFFGFE